MKTLSRLLGTQSAILLVISAMIGTGVFKKVAPMADQLPAPLLLLGCWALAGVVSLAGALTNAEMAGLFPVAGGEYAYYQPVYGRLMAFLYGWTSFVVLKTATMAAQAHVFGQSVLALLGPVAGTFGMEADTIVKLLATALLVLLTLLNYRGLSIAEPLTRALSWVMVASLLAVIVLGLQAKTGSWDHLITSSNRPILQGWSLPNVLILTSLGAFWSYEGWNYIGYMGEEVRNPQRTLPLALGIGTAIVIGVYMLLNAVYLFVLPIDTLARLNAHPDQIAAVEVVRQSVGGVGVMFVSGLIVLTTLNATNATVLMSARLFYAMARDGLFFRSAAYVHPRYQTPAGALAWQGAWAVVLIWSGTFDQLTGRLVFAAFIFYGATAVGVFWLRRKQPHLPRPFRVPGYPILPLLFIIFCGLLVILTLLNQPAQAITGLALIATGLPIYWLWNRAGRQQEAED
ncbi:APC family permease [Fibrella aquatilis]|uniref:Amino acid permease n=1 Tax=Fibrella aquatilis TaxID=2817059 RepID=A0A939G741_9BACT|nr:amino acid permease [Fibrella aquatilis]MBO0933091.1 amino acid permease [Fibrella aquatilis]